MKALLKRLKRLEGVQGILDLPPVEFQTGYAKRLPAEYSGDRHLITVGRDADGSYLWEERPGPEPGEGKSYSVPPFRVILTSAEKYPSPGA